MGILGAILESLTDAHGLGKDYVVSLKAEFLMACHDFTVLYISKLVTLMRT